jgi:hypothetical protein
MAYRLLKLVTSLLSYGQNNNLGIGCPHKFLSNNFHLIFSHDSIEMEEEHDEGEGAEENYANADAQSERTTIIGQTKSPTAFSEDGGTSSTNSRGGAEMEEEG